MKSRSKKKLRGVGKNEKTELERVMNSILFGRSVWVW